MLLRPRLLHGVQHLLHRRPGTKLLIPLVGLRVICLPVQVRDEHRRQRVPGHKHQIDIADLVANQVFVPGLGEVAFKDTQDSLDLVLVAVSDAGEVLLLVEL